MRLVILLGVLLVVGSAAAQSTMDKVGLRVAAEPKPACQSGHDNALSNGVITIRPGETICVALQANGMSVVPARVVASATSQDTMVVKFWQEPGTNKMFLSVHNPLHGFLRYRAEMVRPGSLQYQYTSTCPVLSDRLGIENWPFPITALNLSNFETLPDSKTMECK
jgi:hypothetical protein